MSSLELSDEIYSSEDEDFIIANMERKSGLPDKEVQAKKLNELTANMKMIKSDTTVATVKMTGAMRQGGNLYDSSDSEGEDIMNSMTEACKPSQPDRTGSYSSKTSKPAVDSRSSSVITVKSKSASVTSSSDVTVNGNLSTEKLQEINGISNKRHGSVNSTQSSDFSDITERPSGYVDSRFNPFDRDLHVDEDHFDVKTENHLCRKSPGRHKSGKTF